MNLLIPLKNHRLGTSLRNLMVVIPLNQGLIDFINKMRYTVGTSGATKTINPHFHDRLTVEDIILERRFHFIDDIPGDSFQMGFATTYLHVKSNGIEVFGWTNSGHYQSEFIGFDFLTEWESR
jgi:hypothetical protein